MQDVVDVDVNLKTLSVVGFFLLFILAKTWPIHTFFYRFDSKTIFVLVLKKSTSVGDFSDVLPVSSLRDTE